MSNLRNYPTLDLPVNWNIKQVADPDNNVERIARNDDEAVLSGQLAVPPADGQLSSSRHDKLPRLEVKITEFRGFPLTCVQE